MRTANQWAKVRRSLIILTIAALGCVLTSSSRATTIIVSNTADSGIGSLRAAIGNAANFDTVDASGVTGTIVLTSGPLGVGKNLTIIGPGAGNLSVNGNAAGRVFNVQGSRNYVTISGLTITNGSVGFSSPLQKGGGIYNQASLVLNGCVLSGNSAYSGGAIFNEAPCPSGMICVPERGRGNLTINNSTLTGNFAVFGSGIYNENVASISKSTFCLNEAIEGGGVCNASFYSVGGTMTIVDSCFNNNLAAGAGGISNEGGSMDISDSTFSGNDGGGIYNGGVSSSLIVKFCTFSGNSASNTGSAITGSANVGGTIFSAGNGANLDGGITSLGYNLCSDDGSGCLTAIGDVINTDAQLGPLQDNGGSTKTLALLPGSPAIDAGDPSFTPPPDFDQRGPGFPRAVNGRIDIGAFEFTPDLLITAVDRIGDDLRLTFGVALLGENYEVQSRTNLSSGSWESLAGSIPGNGGNAQVTITNALSVSPQFFRIHQLPAL